MKKLVRITLVLMVALATIAISAACSKSSSTSQSGQQKITTADSAQILDFTTVLPSRFERLNAADEGMSKDDLGLTKEFSEVEVYLSEDPYDMIFAYYGILDSRLDRAASDAVFKDDDQVEKMVIEGLRQGAAQEGVDLPAATVDVSHPIVGDLAVLGAGQMSSFGISVGYDMLVFKVNKVYVFIMSVYLPGDHFPLLDLATEIEKTIKTYSQ